MTGGSPDKKTRHVLSRFASHGFHYKLCNDAQFHVVYDFCICKLCNLSCPKYHALSCPSLGISLTQLAALVFLCTVSFVFLVYYMYCLIGAFPNKERG
jgi:hypothetical protein